MRWISRIWAGETDGASASFRSGKPPGSGLHFIGTTGGVGRLGARPSLEAANLVIDALVGYGLEGPPVGMTAAITQLAMASKRPILALDMPTGVSAVNGEPSATAIHACTTLALDLPKAGLLAPASKPYTGEIYLADLGLPRSVHERMGVKLNGVFSDGPLVHLRR